MFHVLPNLGSETCIRLHRVSWESYPITAFQDFYCIRDYSINSRGMLNILLDATKSEFGIDISYAIMMMIIV